MNASPRVVCVGEVLWDLLPEGPQLGGAPTNVACHLQALGARASLISRVGTDELGDEAWRQLQDRGLDLTGVTRDPHRPTGTVAVDLGADGQPRFTIVEGVAWDSLTATPEAFERVRTAEAICFGSLAQRFPTARHTLQDLLKASAPKALRVFDVNLRAPFYTAAVVQRSLELANVLKLNETELPVLAAQFRLSGSVEEQLEALAGRFELEVVALTLGPAGSRVLRQGQWSGEPGRPVRVKDAVGAGDAFTAVLIMGLLLEWPTRDLLAAATDLAAFVCTQSGATPRLPEPLRSLFRSP